MNVQVPALRQDVALLAGYIIDADEGTRTPTVPLSILSRTRLPFRHTGTLVEREGLNLRSLRNGFTVRPIWPLWYLSI